MNTEPTWLIEGGVVFIDDTRRGVARGRIERLTKTQVVLADGKRFNRQRLTKNIGGTWGGTLDLRSPDDPVMIKKFRSQHYRATVSSVRARVDGLMLAWTRSPEGDFSAAESAKGLLADAISNLSGALA